MLPINHLNRDLGAGVAPGLLTRRVGGLANGVQRPESDALGFSPSSPQAELIASCSALRSGSSRHRPRSSLRR
jgi:hypothetical protein